VGQAAVVTAEQVGEVEEAVDMVGREAELVLAAADTVEQAEALALAPALVSELVSATVGHPAPAESATADHLAAPAHLAPARLAPVLVTAEANTRVKSVLLGIVVPQSLDNFVPNHNTITDVTNLNTVTTTSK
jgi:hypothetical protein